MWTDVAWIIGAIVLLVLLVLLVNFIPRLLRRGKRNTARNTAQSITNMDSELKSGSTVTELMTKIGKKDDEITELKSQIADLSEMTNEIVKTGKDKQIAELQNYITFLEEEISKAMQA